MNKTVNFSVFLCNAIKDFKDNSSCKFVLFIYISLYLVVNGIFILFYIFVFHLVAVKDEDILNDDASHFKLARSVC